MLATCPILPCPQEMLGFTYCYQAGGWGCKYLKLFLKGNKPLASSKASRAEVLFSSTFPQQTMRKCHLPLRERWQVPRDKKDGERKGEEEDVSGGVLLEKQRTRKVHPEIAGTSKQCSTF